MPEPTEDDSVRSGANGKRRRLPGACDVCRRRKVRCDSAQLGGQRCTNCVSTRAECTHARLQVPLKTGRDHVESILSTSVVYIPSNDPVASHRMLVEVAQYARSLEEQLAALTDPPPTANLPTESLSSDTAPNADRYLGKSSTKQFVKSAVKHMHQNSPYVASIQRPELWTTVPQPWEKPTTQRPQHLFPDDDLLHSLVKIYLEQINPLSGILHLPSFRDALADGLHVRDPDFGAVVLVVCASASRYSTDPRVFLEGASEHSCGWKWFRQVQPLCTSFSPVPSLYQLQLICVRRLIPEECWILVGLGIRAAQAASAHHRSGYARMRVAPLESEQYKRVYWILVTTDAFMSSFQGRPAITGSTDVDLDFPVECESEDHYGGSPDAVQPPQTPRTSAFLGAFLRLALIFERIQGAVVRIKSPPSLVLLLLPTSMCALMQTIPTHSAALNGWVELIPEHLLWDPCQENQIFLDQSVILYTTYYHAQILIHRPFIQAPGKAPISNTNFPSLAICANAARACGRIMDLHARRGRGLLPLANVMIALFDSAIVILINVWAVVGPGGPRARTLEDFSRATADAQNCVRVLRLYERRFRAAGRNCDIISVLLNLGKTSADGSGLKRPREPQPDDLALDVFPPSTSQHSPTVSSSILSVEEATPASSGILSVEDEIKRLQISMQEMDPLFTLPLHTEELGRLPVYDSFDYDATFGAGGGPLQLGIPDPYRDAFEPGMHYGHDIALMSDFGMLQDVLHGAGRGQMQVAPQSFDIPSGNEWVR
ncbi:hypothetical protein B0H13DRAFT_1598225 [Mycena leptocephala]|nr:hypothetical protein B0H13DRAFT_1598225 [Mycena leptocephala]